MSSTVIIIPTRLNARRLPDKPLKLIKKKEMILHVYDLALKSGVGDVLVATPDNIISNLILKNNGKSYISKKNHETGTDRVFEAFKNFYLRLFGATGSCMIFFAVSNFCLLTKKSCRF